ncbi:MAG: outer membrane beta-barrel protein [Bacteroidales bacterium]|nr:outer membrane beta-barrel protein [Bacteroidales bacterium]
MKKFVVVLMMIMVAISASAKNDWSGKVVDAQGEPVAYANVAVLSKADSTVICGSVTQEDGSFNIVTKENDGIMMVAMLGYQTVFMTPVDGALITLSEDATLLQSAVATAIMPKTKLTGEGIQTGVRGSVLENAGSARDVLEKTPGIVKSSNGIEVIGKGAPQIYINGHKVTDSSELDRLQSNEIQSIEVITNPSAKYDATVRSVVRIRTIRRQGDGFGFNLNASDAQSLRWATGNNYSGALNMNYRTGGVDIFAGVNYDRSTARQLSDLEKASFGRTESGGDWLFENKGDMEAVYFGRSVYGNAGVNWQIADNHFAGGKVEWGRQLQIDDITTIHDNVYENGTLIDRLTTVSNDHVGGKPCYNVGANLYYNGMIADKLGVDVNFDYYGNGASSTSLSEEVSEMSEDARIISDSENAGRMYAAKAVLTYPIWLGQLEAGTEETFSRRRDEYYISGVDIPASKALVTENIYSGFANYGFMLPNVGMFSAGIRYEYVNYYYRDELHPENDIPRNYGNWFPSFSYAGAAGPVQLMLNYSKKTRRPDYNNLSGVVRYNSRYLWQSGNAQLQPELSHDLSFMAVWSFITAGLEYSRTDDAIVVWSAPYNDEGVVLVKPRNLDTPYRSLGAFVNLTPTIGIWTMNYTFALQPQWLTINAPDPREASGVRKTTFNNKPIGQVQLFNTFALKGGWQLELGGTVTTPGYTQNLYLRNWYCDITAAVQKTLLKDGSLVLRLEGRDLAGMAHFDVDSDFGSHTIMQTNRMDSQKIKFSLRYKFNTAKSKYRGTGAGADTRSRL